MRSCWGSFVSPPAPGSRHGYTSWARGCCSHVRLCAVYLTEPIESTTNNRPGKRWFQCYELDQHSFNQFTFILQPKLFLHNTRINFRSYIVVAQETVIPFLMSCYPPHGMLMINKSVSIVLISFYCQKHPAWLSCLPRYRDGIWAYKLWRLHYPEWDRSAGINVWKWPCDSSSKNISSKIDNWWEF